MQRCHSRVLRARSKRPIDCSDARDWGCLWCAQALQRSAKRARRGFLCAWRRSRPRALLPPTHRARGSELPEKSATPSAAGAARPSKSMSSPSSTTRSARRPAAIDPTGCPVACAPPRAAPSQRFAGDVGRFLVGDHVAHAMAQALAVLERAQLLERAHRDVAVAADGPRAPRLEPRHELEDAVAQVRLGHRAEADARAGRAQRAHLDLREVRRMDEAPARVDVDEVADPGEAAWCRASRCTRRLRPPARRRACGSASSRRGASAASTSSVSMSASTARTEWGATPRRSRGLGR